MTGDRKDQQQRRKATDGKEIRDAASSSRKHSRLLLSSGKEGGGGVIRESRWRTRSETGIRRGCVFDKSDAEKGQQRRKKKEKNQPVAKCLEKKNVKRIKMLN
jgi:hypothetical protein